MNRGAGSPVQACTLLDGLDNPNGIAYDRAAKSLYVAEVGQPEMAWHSMWHG